MGKSSLTVLSIEVLCALALAACATPPSPGGEKAGTAFLKVEYAGRKAAADAQPDALSTGSLLRFSLDGAMVIEHAVNDRSTAVLPLAAGTHRLAFQGVSGQGGGFLDTFEVSIPSGATATFTVICDAYFTGKKKKNFLMNRWEKELALECEMLSSEGFAALLQTEGKEERNILETQWVQQ